MKEKTIFRKTAIVLFIIAMTCVPIGTVVARPAPAPAPYLIVSGLDITLTPLGKGETAYQILVENHGDATATHVEYGITYSGGFILKGRQINGTTADIAPGDLGFIDSGHTLGFGKVTVTLTVTCAEGTTLTWTHNAFQLCRLTYGLGLEL